MNYKKTLRDDIKYPTMKDWVLRQLQEDILSEVTKQNSSMLERHRRQNMNIQFSEIIDLTIPITTNKRIAGESKKLAGKFVIHKTLLDKIKK